MRSTQDAINGIKIYLNNWGILSDKETKVSVEPHYQSKVT
jgi:hypothetical protein